MEKLRRWFDRSQWMAGSLALIAAAAIVALAMLPASASPRPAGASPSVKNYATDMALNDIAADAGRSIDQALQGTPDYAYIQVTAAGLNIGLTDSGASTKTLVAGLDETWGVPISYTYVQNSAQDLAQVTQDLDSAHDKLAAEGINMVTWGPDISTNTVRIGLNPYSDAAAAVLESTYGPIVSVNPTTVTAFAGADRTSDAPPFFGGDEMVTSGESCTSWFSANDHTKGYHVTITAGHCGTGTWTSPGTGDRLGVVNSSGVHWGGTSPDRSRDSGVIGA